MTISILGAGWLGWPLAQRLAAQQHLVKASTTSVEKYEQFKVAGLSPYLLRLSNDAITGEGINDFFDTETLIISLPPKRQMPDLETVYPQQIKAILAAAEGSPSLKRIIYWSSIGIYGDEIDGVVTEEDLDPSQDTSLAWTGGNKALLYAERLLAEFSAKAINQHIDTIILRLGGLIGEGRQPGRFFAGKTDIPNGQQRINLVQGEDVLDITSLLLTHKPNNTFNVFNIVPDEHPTRAEFYPLAATKLGLAAPSFKLEIGSGKIVSNTAIKTLLNYQFRTLT